MDKNKFTKAVEKVLEGKGLRNFKQSIDIIINLKEIDIKKTDQQFDFFVTLPHSKGKGAKVCGLVGPELQDEAKKIIRCGIRNT